MSVKLQIFLFLMGTVICLAPAGIQPPRIWTHTLMHAINSSHSGFVCMSEKHIPTRIELRSDVTVRDQAWWGMYII